MLFCCTHQKLPPEIEQNKSKDTQLNNVQRVRDLDTLSPKWEVSNKPLPLGLRELCRRGSKMIVRTSRDGRHQPCLPDTTELMHM